MKSQIFILKSDIECDCSNQAFDMDLARKLIKSLLKIHSLLESVCCRDGH